MATPPLSRADYLAKYLSPAGSGKKKRKRAAANATTSGSALVIDEDEQLSVAAVAPSAASISVISSGKHFAHSVAADEPLPSTTEDMDIDAAADAEAEDQGVMDDTSPPSPKRCRMRHDSDDDEDDDAHHRRGNHGDHPDPMKTGHAQQAATVYRAADGRKVSAAELKDERNAGARAEEEKDRANRLWMMGRVQAREVAERKKIEAGSVTRTADDQDMNDMLRDRQRWGDPGSMMGLMEKYKANKRKTAGRPVYEGTYAPNRYGIVPGFRWDGVDRSNGFEKRLFVIRNEQESAREAAYKWRSEDM